MEYWPSVPWKAVVSSSSRMDPTDLAIPFALIGSHRLCNIRIRRRRFPPLAYIAFSFEDSIEVWPLCALAYSQWGILHADQTLRVGRTQIQLIPSGLAEQSKLIATQSIKQKIQQKENAIGKGDVPTILNVNFRGKNGSFVLNRRVVIVGSDHPSTRRLHGVGLATCEQAIVNLGQRCWLINLNPKREKSLHDLVTLLSAGQDEVKIGKIKVSVRLPNSEELLAKTESGSSDRLVSSGSHRSHLVHAQVHPISTKPTPTESAPTESAPTESAPTEAGPIEGQPFFAAEDKIAAKAFELEDAEATDSDLDFGNMDDVTSVITDRLVSISQSQWRHRRLIRIVLIAVLFLAASTTLYWIVTRFVLPIVRDLQGW